MNWKLYVSMITFILGTLCLGMVSTVLISAITPEKTDEKVLICTLLVCFLALMLLANYKKIVHLTLVIILTLVIFINGNYYLNHEIGAIEGVIICFVSFSWILTLVTCIKIRQSQTKSQTFYSI